MALPKKVIPNINLVPPKILLERREQLLEDITKDGTYLPKNLGYAEMDRGFLDFVKNELKTVVEGRIIPTVDILITTQNWAQFTQTWSFQDLNGNTEPPFITVVRVPEVKYGTNPATLYNIPNQKEFFYAAVPTWNGNVKGLDIYKIPQPVPVDISFNVKIVCNRMRELNEFNKNVLQTFASRQAYTKVNGHFIPIVNTGISDESVTQVDKRRFYIQNYDFTLLGFLLDQDKFEVAPAVSRVLNVFETNMKPINRKRKRFPVNEGVFDLTVQAVRNSPVVRTISVDYTGTFTILSTQNVSTYDLFIRLSTNTEFDYYGTNVVNFEVSTGDQLRFEITQENTDPTSIITYGVSFLGSPQNLTFDLPTPSITPSNTTTPSNTPTKTQTPSFTPSTTPNPTPNPTCTSTQGICYNYELSQVDAGGRGDWRFYSCSDGQLIEITIENNQIAFVCSRSQPVQFGGVFFNLPILLDQCGLYCVGPTPTPSVTKTQTPSISVTPSSTLTSTPTPTNLIVVQLVSSFGCGTINVPLILTNANNLTSISMTINYDDTNLSFVNIFGENPNLGFAYIINDIGGQIKFVWFSMEPKNLSGTLFSISFSANTSYTLSNISFDLSIPENNEITYGLQDNIASVSYINGTIESVCPTPTPTTSNTPTISSSSNVTPSVTQTNTITPTFTTTPTVTTSLNSTPNPTSTNTPTPTITTTLTLTSTPTPTPTPTCSTTPSPTPTNTTTQTNTKTPLGTPLSTRTPTMTPTPTNTSTPTLTSSVTITPTTTTTLTLTPTLNQCLAPATLIDCSGFTLNVIGSFIRIEYVNCLNVVQSDLRIDILTTICSLTIPQVTYVAPDTSYSIIFTNVCGSFCNNLTPTPTKTPTTTPTETRVKYLLYGVLTPAAGSTNPGTACALLTSETAQLFAYSLKPLDQLTTGDVIYDNNTNLPKQSFANRYRALSATSDVSTPKYVLWWQNSGTFITTVTLCSQLPTLTPTPTPTVTPLFTLMNALFVPCFIDQYFVYTRDIAIWVQVNQTEVLINEKGTIYIENHPIYGNSCWRFSEIRNTEPGFSLINYQGLYFDNINQCMDNYGIKCPVSSGTTYMNL